MRLEFDHARLVRTAANLPAPYDTLLGVDATVRLYDATGHVICTEHLVRVVELANALQRWLTDDQHGVHTGTDFSFYSVESDDTGQLWVQRAWGDAATDLEPPDGSVSVVAASWRVGSVHPAPPRPLRVHHGGGGC